MPCNSTYYICNTDIPGADDSYLDTGTYNDREYYSGETDGWVIYFYTGATSYWCLSNTLGGSCYLTGKSPCTSECPDLCDDYLSVKPCCPNNLVVNGQFTSNLDGWDYSIPYENWIWDSSFNGSALYDGADEGGYLSQDILTINHEYDITVDLNFSSGVTVTCTTISLYAGTNEYSFVPTEGDSSVNINITCSGNTTFSIYTLNSCLDTLYITNVCITDVTPVVDCDILDFTALFDCEYMPTPTPTPTSTLTPTPTPSASSNYCSTVGVDAVATINQSTPTPTPTPTPTSTPSIVRDCSFSGDVVWNITQGNILCPFNQQFQDCVNDDMYYVNIVTGLNITPSKGEVFKANVNGVSKCISYVGIDFNNSPSGTIEITNGPFGSLETGCENCKNNIFPTPTPTQTPTNTPTPTPTEPPRYRFLPNNLFLPNYSAYLNGVVDNSTNAYFYGYFTGYSVNDVVVPARRIIKLNQDLTIDYSFTGGTGFVGPFPLVYNGESILQQPDGKIITTGYFTSYSGVSKNRIVRLNVDGSIDNTFVMGSGFAGGLITPYTTVAGIDSLDNIIVPGAFTTYNGVTAPMSYLVKLSSGGTMDMLFSATTSFDGPPTIPQTVLVNPDDSMYVTGYFTSFSGISANHIIKLQSNGYKDNSFDYGTGFNSTGNNPINTFRISGETSFYVVGSNNSGGGFTTYNGIPVNRILKLMSDGTIDSSFNSGTGFSGGTGFGADGLFSYCRIIWTNKLLLNGYFTSYNGTPSINFIILNSDGTVFQSFTTTYIIMFTIGNKLYGQTATGYLTLIMTYP